MLGFPPSALPQAGDGAFRGDFRAFSCDPAQAVALSKVVLYKAVFSKEAPRGGRIQHFSAGNTLVQGYLTPKNKVLGFTDVPSPSFGWKVTAKQIPSRRP